jgi:hypothetical protein
LKIWRSGREEIIENGEYLVPFSKQNEQITILAVKDSYADKFYVNLYPESYSFDVGLIYNHESFIVGKKAKVVLHPTLKLGG